MRKLKATETRVLATLMEKSRTVPDSYPMTLNTLVAGCNQKSNRDPWMQLDEADVLQALDALRDLSLVMETSGGRVTRFEHNAERAIGVPGAAAALLGLLMLRGPQTAGELRIHTERWHRFADISSVEAFLEELQDRRDEKGGPLVRQLARAPGTRETRWMHLLCDVDATAYEPGGNNDAAGGAPCASNEPGGIPADQWAALQERVARLESDLSDLRQALGVADAATP